MTADATPVHPSRSTPDTGHRIDARPVPLAVYDRGDGARASVLYARELSGGTAGQLPRSVELVLVEHEISDDELEAGRWTDLELEGGRVVMSERFILAMRRHVKQSG